MEFRCLFSRFGLHIKDQPLVADGQGQMIRPFGHRALLPFGQDKAVLFQQVEHGHLTLLIDLRRGGRHVRVIKRDMGDAGHGRILFAGDTISWIAQRWEGGNAREHARWRMSRPGAQRAAPCLLRRRLLPPLP